MHIFPSPGMVIDRGQRQFDQRRIAAKQQPSALTQCTPKPQLSVDNAINIGPSRMGLHCVEKGRIVLQIHAIVVHFIFIISQAIDI
jgi:hypothetical protein